MLNEKVVPCGIDVDISTAVDNLCDSINMKNFHEATYLVQFVDLGTADTTVLVYSGASDAACTSALPFKYRWASATTTSATCDVFGAWTDCAATGLVVAHGTYDNFMLQIYVDAAAMDVANGEEWLTVDFKDVSGGATGQAIVIALLKPRYADASGVTCLA